jgi:flagellar basal-body rod protein FlgB
MTQDLAIFKAMNAKMQYLDVRQKVIAQNVSNSDTPGYRSRDLTELDFGNVLDKVRKGPQMNVSLQGTHPDHKPGPNEIPGGDRKKQRISYEVAPSGNAVVLEEEMMKSNQNMMDYNMMTNLYRKHIAMLKSALGSGGGQ